MSKSHAVTSVHVDYVEYCFIRMISMLSFSNNTYNVLKSLGYLHINIIQDLQRLNHIQLTLFMIITLSIALLRRFVSMLSLSNYDCDMFKSLGYLPINII